MGEVPITTGFVRIIEFVLVDTENVAIECGNVKVQMRNRHFQQTDGSNCVGERQQITINISTLEGRELQAILLNTI